MSSIWNPQDRFILSNMTSEKLYAKSPLTTGVSGTSAYIGLEPSATYNETVLFSGDGNGANSGTLTENAENFNSVEIYGHTNDGEQWYTKLIPGTNNGWGIIPLYHCTTNGEIWFKGGRVYVSGTSFAIQNVREKANSSITGSWTVIDSSTLKIPVDKIVGINRKEV